MVLKISQSLGWEGRDRPSKQRHENSVDKSPLFSPKLNSKIYFQMGDNARNHPPDGFISCKCLTKRQAFPGAASA